LRHATGKALAAQQRADLSRLAARVYVAQDPKLVLRRKASAPRTLDKLWIGDAWLGPVGWDLRHLLLRLVFSPSSELFTGKNYYRSNVSSYIGREGPADHASP
jgi:hypothetical protein